MRPPDGALHGVRFERPATCAADGRRANPFGDLGVEFHVRLLFFGCSHRWDYNKKGGGPWSLPPSGSWVVATARPTEDAAGRAGAIRYDRQGAQGAGFHAFRHAVASELIDSGAPITVVQAQMRHSDPRITLGLYGHVIPQSQRDAVGGLAARLEGQLLTEPRTADSAA
jgi:hypothetical protein